MTRREAIKRMLMSAAAFGVLPFGLKPAVAAQVPSGCSGMLSIVNIHTNEALTVRYLQKNGRFDTKALKKLNRLFRCHYTNDVRPIAPELFVLLDSVYNRVNAQKNPIRLISGFRSEAYNDLLRSRSRNVARNSFHLKGMAADISIEGIRLNSIREAAAGLKAGGVGHYSQFIHMDVGPVRYW